MTPSQETVNLELLGRPRFRTIDTTATCRKLLKQELFLWTFVWIEGIQTTNNDADHVLRHAMLWRKSSGGTDSETGSRFVERMLSIVATARQQNCNVLKLLTTYCAARLDSSATHRGRTGRRLIGESLLIASYPCLLASYVSHPASSEFSVTS